MTLRAKPEEFPEYASRGLDAHATEVELTTLTPMLGGGAPLNQRPTRRRHRRRT